MARGQSKTLYQESQVVSLYKQGKSIKEIISETGIKSEHTIYRLLDKNNIPRRATLKGTPKTFYIEEDVSLILKEQPNISRYVNEAIRYYYKKGKNRQQI